MNRIQTNAVDQSGVRSPYRAPLVTVVLHLAETQQNAGAGFDKGKNKDNHS